MGMRSLAVLVVLLLAVMNAFSFTLKKERTSATDDVERETRGEAAVADTSAHVEDVTQEPSAAKAKGTEKASAANSFFPHGANDLSNSVKNGKSSPSAPQLIIPLLVGTDRRLRHPGDIEWRLQAAKDGETVQMAVFAGEDFERCVDALQSIISGADVADSLNTLDLAGQKGNRDALYFLGELYYYGSIHSLRHVSEYVAPVVERNVAKAIGYYEAAAALGHPQAHTALGLLYAVGRDMPQDHAKSLIHYQVAAMDGDYEARMAMSHRSHFGSGVSRSCRDATMWYEPVAQAVAQDYLDTGLHWMLEHERLFDSDMEDAQEEEDVVQYYQYAAESGDVDSQVTLGMLHLQGIYVTRDFAQSKKYFDLAAAENDPAGLFYLGVLSRKGHGVEASNETALQYFERAARLGSGDAQAELGLMYFQGAGVPQNFKKALSYFEKGVESSNAQAMLYLALCHVYNVGGASKDFGKAAKYLVSSAHAGVLPAQFNLAQMYSQGVGLSRSCTNALHLYKKIAESGYMGTMAKQAHLCYEGGDYEGSLRWYERAGAMGMEVAQHNAAWLLEKNLGLSDAFVNHTANFSFEYYRQSAQQGNALAHLKMGDSYFYGRGTERSHKNAAVAYQRASNLRNAQATFNLGYMHQYGLGLPRDLFLAKRYFDLSSELNPEALVPSSLALVWLGAYHLWEYPYAESIYGWFSAASVDPEIDTQDTPIDVFNAPTGLNSTLSQSYDWDMVAIIGLLVALAIVIMIRQHIVHNIRAERVDGGGE